MSNVSKKENRKPAKRRSLRTNPLLDGNSHAKRDSIYASRRGWGEGRSPDDGIRSIRGEV